MVVKLYISGISGNKEVKKKQQRVQMILDSKLVRYEAIDITEPGREQEKEFMQQKGKVREVLGKHPLPPQIFNESDYCGDYEDFDMANEVDELEAFLHIPIPSKLSAKSSAIDDKINGSLQDTTVSGARNGTHSTEVNGDVELTSIIPEIDESNPTELADGDVNKIEAPKEDNAAVSAENDEKPVTDAPQDEPQIDDNASTEKADDNEENRPDLPLDEAEEAPKQNIDDPVVEAEEIEDKISTIGSVPTTEIEIVESNEEDKDVQHKFSKNSESDKVVDKTVSSQQVFNQIGVENDKKERADSVIEDIDSLVGLGSPDGTTVSPITGDDEAKVQLSTKTIHDTTGQLEDIKHSSAAENICSPGLVTGKHSDNSTAEVDQRSGEGLLTKGETTNRNLDQSDVNDGDNFSLGDKTVKGISREYQPSEFDVNCPNLEKFEGASGITNLDSDYVHSGAGLKSGDKKEFTTDFFSQSDESIANRVEADVVTETLGNPCSQVVNQRIVSGATDGSDICGSSSITQANLLTQNQIIESAEFSTDEDNNQTISSIITEESEILIKPLTDNVNNFSSRQHLINNSDQSYSNIIDKSMDVGDCQLTSSGKSESLEEDLENGPPEHEGISTRELIMPSPNIFNIDRIAYSPQLEHKIKSPGSPIEEKGMRVKTWHRRPSEVELVKHVRGLLTERDIKMGNEGGTDSRPHHDFLDQIFDLMNETSGADETVPYAVVKVKEPTPPPVDPPRSPQDAFIKEVLRVLNEPPKIKETAPQPALVEDSEFLKQVWRLLDSENLAEAPEGHCFPLVRKRTGNHEDGAFVQKFRTLLDEQETEIMKTSQGTNIDSCDTNNNTKPERDHNAFLNDLLGLITEQHEEHRVPEITLIDCDQTETHESKEINVEESVPPPVYESKEINVEKSVPPVDESNVVEDNEVCKEIQVGFVRVLTSIGYKLESIRITANVSSGRDQIVVKPALPQNTTIAHEQFEIAKLFVVTDDDNEREIATIVLSPQCA